MSARARRALGPVTGLVTVVLVGQPVSAGILCPQAVAAGAALKAVFVFTAVTRIFLPLSFFTSYFGMNLDGIVNTTRAEAYFWTVCGAMGIAIVLIIITYACRIKVRYMVRTNRETELLV